MSLAGRILSLAVLAVAATPAHADGFLKAIVDMPLMAGLTEQADPVIFESPQGRIVKVSVHGARVHIQPATDFYLATLPALGWERQADQNHMPVFKRGTEELKLDIIEITGDGPPGTTVTFELVVKLASSKLPE